MRVVMGSVDEFCDELLNNLCGGPNAVVDRTVRMRIDRTPEQSEAITFEIGLCLSAVIANERAAYLIEFGGICGSDDKTDPMGGTKIARTWAKMVKRTCQKGNLKIRPGKLEMI